MNILILNWQDIRNPLAGGAEVHLHEVFSRIAGMGHNVTLYCSSFPGAPKEETLNGIHIIREGGRYLFNFRVPFRYFTTFRKQSFDIVIDDMNKIPFFTPLFVKKPLYIITHHLFKKSIFLETAWPLAMYVYLMEKIGFGLCRVQGIPFIVGSPSTKTELIEIGFQPSLIEIINYCVDHKTHTPAPSARSSTPLIGCFGRLKKYKSIEHLLQAFAVVVRQVPEVRLVVVGEGDNRQALEAMSRELGISETVQFTGFVEEREKVRWLQKVWFAVNTSSKEGWGLTVIEANACGTMVLASDVPGLRDAVKDDETGMLYEFGNVEELTKKILLLLTDSAHRGRLAANANSWASTFDWNNAAKHTYNLLQSRINSSQTFNA